MRPSPGVTIITYHSGPDQDMRYSFTMDWWQVGGMHFDKNGRVTDATEGPRGQCFFADPKPYIERLKAKDERVIERRESDVRHR